MVLFDVDQLLDLVLDLPLGLAHLLLLARDENGVGVGVLGRNVDACLRLVADLFDKGALLANDDAVELFDDLQFLLVIVLLELID